MGKQKQDELVYHLIDIYRDLVAERYAFDNLERHFDLPETVTPDKVARIRDYFLNYIYPDGETRIDVTVSAMIIVSASSIRMSNHAVKLNTTYCVLRDTINVYGRNDD